MALPITEQYLRMESRLRNKGDNYLLLFKLGDFWEAYRESAKTLNKHLGTPISRRNGVLCSGFPHHAKENSLKELVKAGLEIILAEQPANNQE